MGLEAELVAARSQLARDQIEILSKPKDRRPRKEIEKEIRQLRQDIVRAEAWREVARWTDKLSTLFESYPHFSTSYPHRPARNCG